MARAMKAKPEMPDQDEIRLNIRRQMTHTKSIKAMDAGDGRKSTKTLGKQEIRKSHNANQIDEGFSQSFDARLASKSGD